MYYLNVYTQCIVIFKTIIKVYDINIKIYKLAFQD